MRDGSQLLSSMIVYKLEENIFGIGSISTPVCLRNKNYGSKLIFQTLELLTNEFHASAIFLYSDIKPKFYEKFGFKKLPQNYQRYKDTSCMVRVENLEEFLSSHLNVPEYFLNFQVMHLMFEKRTQP